MKRPLPRIGQIPLNDGATCPDDSGSLRRSPFSRAIGATVVLILLLSAGASAQPVWKQLQGPYQGMLTGYHIDGANGRIYAFLYPSQVFRSDDEGESWKQVSDTSGLPLVATKIFEANGRLWAVDVNPQQAIAQNLPLSLYRSEDRGKTWARVASPFAQGAFTSIAIDLPTIILTRAHAVHEPGMLVSRDSGRTYQPCEVDPAIRDNSIVLDYGKGIAAITEWGLYLTRDGGESWRQLSDTLTRSTEVIGRFGSTIITRRYTYYNTGATSATYLRISDSGRTVTPIRFHEESANGWMSTDGKDLYFHSVVEGSFRSTDLGTTWEPVTIDAPIPFNRAIPLADGEFIVGIFQTAGYVERVEGLFRSYQGGKRWLQTGGNPAEDLTDLEFRGDTVFAAARQLWRNVDGGNRWELMTQGEAYVTDVEFSDVGDTTWIVYGGYLWRAQRPGAAWEQLKGFTKDDLPGALLWNEGELFLPIGQAHTPLLARGLQRSTTQGLTWSWTEHEGVAGIASRDVVGFDSVIYARGFRAADSLPLLYRSVDRGASWTVLDSTLPYFRPGVDNRLQLRMNDGYVTTRYDSTSFMLYDIQEYERTGLLGRYRLSVSDPGYIVRDAIRHGGADYLIAQNLGYLYDYDTTSLGVLRSDDHGATWGQINAGLPQRPGSDARFFANGDRLYMLSRGLMYYLDLVPRHHLTVENGYGSGEYRAGDTVHIFARELGENTVFRYWGAPLLERHIDLPRKPFEWHTTFLMPDEDVTLRAFVSPGRRIDPLLDTFMLDGRIAARYVMPDEPAGVILLFHDGGDSAAGWFTSTEQRQFVRDGLAYDFAFIAFDVRDVSPSDTDRQKWDLSAPLDANGDIAWAAGVFTALRAKVPALAGIPMFTLGVGNGGNMAAAFAAAQGYRVTALYSAGGTEATYDVSHPASLFSLTLREPPGSDAANLAAAHARSLAQQDIPSDVVLNGPAPLYPERFARIAGIDVATSRKIFEELSLAGHLNAAGVLVLRPPYRMLLDDPGTIIDRVESVPEAYPTLRGLTPEQRREVYGQLNASWSNPIFYSDLDDNTLSFFLSFIVSGVETRERSGGVELEFSLW